MVKVVSFIKKA